MVADDARNSRAGNANADAVMLTVGPVILWPLLIGIAATTDRREELGKLRGKYEAVDGSVRSRHCPLPPSVAPGVIQAPPATVI